MTITGSALFRIQLKLQKIATDCRHWCLNYKKEYGIQWDNLNQELLEDQMENQSPENREKERNKRRDFRASTDIKLEYWKQRVRVKWDNLGDQPSSFFYKSMKSRKGGNDIKAIKDSRGNWTVDENKIKEEFASFFEQLFNPGESAEERMSTREWLEEMPRLSNAQFMQLDEPFSSEEIKGGIFSMSPLKSPGPDGIPPIFYQEKWEIIGDEVCQATKNFLEGGNMLRETNKTFIALIPKVSRPENVGQYRPISLCNTSYKIISKCLFRRL